MSKDETGTAPDGTKYLKRRANGPTYWNGEKLDPPARQCLLLVGDLPLVAHYWAREAGLLNITVSAVEVQRPGNEPMYLFDGDGSGWEKVTQHRGSPRVGHKNISGVVQGYKDEPDA